MNTTTTKPRRKRTRSFSGPKDQVATQQRNRPGRKGGKGKALDPALLIKKAVHKEVEKYISPRSFDQLPINDRLKSIIAEKGYLQPTQIQEETIEHLMAGRDMVGIASTGTGKTGAFLIPVIQRLIEDGESGQALIIVPTRELAQQVEEEFRSLTKGLKLFAGCFIGGTSVGKDISRLRKKNHVIIGTPGRLMDLADRRALRFQDISTLILDEFDRMLDMGFVNDIEKIVGMMKKREQTMLFSATIDKTQASMISKLLNNPVEVKISSGTSTSDQVEQDVIRVPRSGDKFQMLLDMVNDSEFDKVLIFAETKRAVDKVTQKLNKSGVRSDQIHGDKSQNYRSQALSKFKRGAIQVLVATDVAARGIDVSDISHVINYQLPTSYDSYVHRIGRTGRAGKTGKAFTFVD